MALSLLPAPQDSPLCSEFSRSLEVRPAGTGLFLDRVILVAVPLPWPKPALKHPSLITASAAATASPTRSRLFAAEPDVDRPLRVEVFDRLATQTRYTDLTLATLTDIESVTAAVAATPLGEAVEGSRATVEFHGPLEQPMLLLCTQGSHDQCCGTAGVALADELDTLGTVPVRRVSHTGGHRFAPTALSLPSGRMWTWMDAALAVRVSTQAETTDDLTTRCRGWWGTPTGPAQVAELAARTDHGKPWTSAPIVAEDDGSPGVWRVSGDSYTWTITVTIAREFPSISCATPGGLPAKPGREYASVIVDRQGGVEK